MSSNPVDFVICYFRACSLEAIRIILIIINSVPLFSDLFYFPAWFDSYSYQVGGFTLSGLLLWTSRGHRCRPSSPLVRAFIFIAQSRVQRSHCARRISSDVAS